MSLAGMASDNLQAIVGEIDLLKNLRHKNIVKYIGSFKTKTHLSIILEYMEKGSLADVIRPAKFGAFPESLAALYIAQVLHGLAYLHEQGVVHRDIKGANILTGSESVVKLADFGVAAKLTGASEGDESLRQSVVGTPYWMAPEVIEMTSVTAAADIWSVGCLCIELLTGQPPYFDLQPMSALFRIVQDEHPALPDNLSEDMQGFLLECFRKDPQRRPGARALLRHAWLRQQSATLRSAWSSTVKARGGRTDAHASVTDVVERILRADGNDTASLGPDAASESRESSPAPGRRALPGAPGRKDSAGSLESRAPPLEGRAPPRSSSGAELQPRVSRISVADLPERPTLLGRPSSLKGEPELVTPAQRGEVPRARTPQRPPPLDTSSPSLGRSRDMDDANPLGALLASLSASHPMPAQVGDSQGLLAWLEDSDMQNGAMPAGSPKPVALPGAPGAAPKHQQAAEIRRLVGALRPAVQSMATSGAAASARDTPVLDACQQLTALLPEQQERRSTFVAENGIACLIELLDERNAKVTLAALELANALISNDTASLEAGCLLGLVPAVLRYAFPSQPLPLRMQAAAFAAALCHASTATARMFVACQGMPVLAALMEDRLAEAGFLTQTAITCTWHMLQLQGTAFPLNHLCRLLAADGMPLRLVQALSALCTELHPSPAGSQGHESPTESRYAPSEASVSSMHEDPSLDDDAASRITSNSLASSSRGAGSSRLSTVGLNSYFRSSRQSTASVAPAGPAVRRAMPKQAAHRRGSSLSGSSPDVLGGLIDTVGNILLVLAHADSVVKGAIGRRETLLALFGVMNKLDRRERALLKCLKCLRLLTFDPALLQPLQDAGTIPRLLPFLGRTNPVSLQLEALHALYNLCKISRTRQEAAAVAGVVPRLIALVSTSPKATDASVDKEGQQGAQLRPLAISLICGMAHSTQRTRAELWAHNGLELLLNLLQEQAWQGAALDALAAWLSEDASRVEPRLAQREACQRFVALFAAYAPAGDSEALSRLLKPFLRILRHSKRITVEMGQGGLTPIVLDTLAQTSALTALDLLQVLRTLFEFHPRPKQYVAQHGILEHLQRLASGGDRSRRHAPAQSVLVQKQAGSLLQALRVQSVI
ncbi:hypothetical protein CVIRNUC_000395 [Coccomyxa viridis]|uniref:Protein kinase domain-containing protein n=1 Tax=Coccomyxa viridis TaxID=1274662 RepID=A0AAV1HR96_9CHLO|nr:hypothetical protein CVIRNUC_000395 [Coccomyxa viridis]